ncbi:MAG TPA: primase-helicase family protein, partial [Gemmataceae bacterium]|nr:primase-helicase family protein [Gemmataceae bacterium]
GVPTANHTEHAALARAILVQMGIACGYDFTATIDTCGGNIWIAHKKATKENEGFKLLHARRAEFAPVPDNWHDHLEVVTKRRSRIRIKGVEDEDSFERLLSAHRRVPMDTTHKRHIDELAKSGYTTIWVPDHHLLQTHTKALEWLTHVPGIRVIGVYRTSSAGTDKGSPNCFLFPMSNGSWKVYRFSPGVAEAPTWEQDGQGWTTCFFNRIPTFPTAARAAGGKEDEGGRFVFSNVTQAAQAAVMLGARIDVPEALRGRTTVLKQANDGRLLVSIQAGEGDTGMDSWLEKKGNWIMLHRIVEGPREDIDSLDTDSFFRMLRIPAKLGLTECGAMFRQDDGQWCGSLESQVKHSLQSIGYNKAEADCILGTACRSRWELVNLPFQPEEPGGRRWNLGAAQYAYEPAELDDDEAPHHPHWDKVLRHLGQDIDDHIGTLEWAQQCGIRHGGQYLQAWIACLMREPLIPLPYLFLYGAQNNGKSTLHESVQLLMRGGVVNAKNALITQNEFNGELENKVLAFIEEVDLTQYKAAEARLKEWVTAETIMIRSMHRDGRNWRNTLHFIHCANDDRFCPVFPGDTRIDVIYVNPLKAEIPKSILMDRLRAEAPHFMRTLMEMQLPPLMGRMRLPVIDGLSKQILQQLNRNPVESFLEEHCYQIPGEMVTFKEVYDRFAESLDFGEQKKWGHKSILKRSLPRHFPVGIGPNKQLWVGNLAFEHVKQTKPPVVLHGGRLAHKEAA